MYYLETIIGCPPYMTTIYHKGIRYDLGKYWTLEEAIIVRYNKAKELFGDYINIVEEEAYKEALERREYKDLEREYELLLK